MDPLTIALIGSAAIDIIGGIFSGNARRRYADALVREGDRLANDAIDRGREVLARYQIDLSQVMGTQRATFAAQGVDASFGTAAAIARETALFGERDIATIRANAMREARGIRAAARGQAAGQRAQATQDYFGAAASAGWSLYNLRRARVPSSQPAGVTYDAGYGPPMG